MREKRLLAYLKPYWWLVLLAPLSMVLEVSMDLLQPQLMSTIVDDGVLGGDMQLILSTGLWMLGVALVGGVGGVASGAFASAAAQGFGDDLRRDAFAKVMSLSCQQTDRFTTGSLVTRMTNDITAVQELVNMSLRMFVRTSIQFAGGIAMLLALNVNFGMILLFSLPVQLLCMWLFLSKASPLFSVVQRKLDRVNAVVQENVTGTRVIKAYVREQHEIERFSQANNQLMDTSLRVQKLMARLNPILMIIMNASVVAIILIGGYQVEARAMQVGQVMAAITYITQILMSMMMVGMMFQTISRARASAERIREVLYTQPALQDGASPARPGQGRVEFRGVSFHYPNYSAKPVLRDISFTVEPGQTVAILGATGCGKSSLVSLVPRFYDATGGAVLVDGVDVRDYPLEALRAKIGFVLQKSELFSGTVLDNLRWGNPDATEEEARRAARIAQADEFITGFQEGYRTMVSEKGASLSGGQKQRMAIARAILKMPEILIFDDSTSALDLATEARLQAALRQNLQGTTVILIAQRVASVKNADRIAVLEDGALAAFGTHEQLLQSCGVYQDIYRSQVREGDEQHA